MLLQLRLGSGNPRGWWLARLRYIRHTYNISLVSTADAKADIYRDRYNLLLQRILHNENFSPPSFQNVEKDSYLKVWKFGHVIVKISVAYTLISLCQLDYSYQ